MTFSAHNDLSKGIEAVLRIRIRRIRRFLGHLDPDQDPSITKENRKKTLIPTALWLLLSLKNDLNVPSKSNKQNNFFLLVFFWHFEGHFDENRRIRIDIRTRIRIGPRSGSTPKYHRSTTLVWRNTTVIFKTK